MVVPHACNMCSNSSQLQLSIKSATFEALPEFEVPVQAMAPSDHCMPEEWCADEDKQEHGQAQDRKLPLFHPQY